MLVEPSMEELNIAHAMEFREAAAPAYDECGSSIEMAISKMKSLLWKLGRRSIPDLKAAIGQAARAITESDARGCITHCGYGDASE